MQSAAASLTPKPSQHGSFNIYSATNLTDFHCVKVSQKREQETPRCTFSFVLIGKAKKSTGSDGGVQVLNRTSSQKEGDIPCQLIFLFKRILRTHTPPSSKGTFSCVKHASDWTCKHRWRTHSNALIIGSNQMNYRWPVWWIIQRYILSSDINITFSLCPPSWIFMP